VRLDGSQIRVAVELPGLNGKPSVEQIADGEAGLVVVAVVAYR